MECDCVKQLLLAAVALSKSRPSPYEDVFCCQGGELKWQHKRRTKINGAIRHGDPQEGTISVLPNRFDVTSFWLCVY